MLSVVFTITVNFDMRRPYTIFGITLCLFGVIITPVGYFIVDSLTITAFGISSLMIGFTAIALSYSRPSISPEASELMLRAGLENTAALLEEIGVQGQAVYLPSSMGDDGVNVLVPLNSKIYFKELRKKIPRRLIVQYGTTNDSFGIAITTPGGIALRYFQEHHGLTDEDLQSRLTSILVGAFDLAGAVQVTETEEELYVKVHKPIMGHEKIWYYEILGSPLASIVASVVSDYIDNPVMITNETTIKNNTYITIRR
jgi:hypothetical protein